MQRLLLLLALSGFLTVRPASGAQEKRIRNVAILVYPGVELLDFAGPGEVFATTHYPNQHAFEVYTVAETKEPVKSLDFVAVTPQYTLDDCPKPDIVVVPGGNVPGGEKVLSWVRARAKDTEVMMSVCNGALVYAHAGLLKDLEVTTHKSALQAVALIEPTARVCTNRRFVDNGKVLTSAGISAGIDGALHLVSRLCGDDVAWRTARYMEYDWRPDELAKMHAQPGVPVEGAEAMKVLGSIQKLGVERAAAEMQKLAEKPTEADLNRWGYTLLRGDKVAQAIDVFRLAAAAFPDSANAADSLSEALEASGDKDGAKRNAQTCLDRLAKDGTMEAERKAILHNAASSRVARLSGANESQLRFVCPACGGSCDTVGYLEATRCPGCPMQLVERSKVSAAR
jgi:transcriptional regulator GlxA family with amidase domain